MPDRNRIIDQFFGDAAAPIQWADEAEKRLHFWHDDLHCPQPISPMWFDVGGWWLTCGYMFRRFGVPFGKEWVAKTINEYVMSAVVPRDPKEEAELAPYFQMVLLLFTKISGLITDSGGALSHPAVVSREFGIPAVVGTGVATQKIQTGQRVRVNGAAGLVEILA
jgi:PEP-utilising enzyme, mobile domain